MERYIERITIALKKIAESMKRIADAEEKKAEIMAAAYPRQEKEEE